MFDIKVFNEKESKQSHSFLFFAEGPPYCELGWEKYRLFNELISSNVDDFKKDYGIEVFVYEHEIIDIEGRFLWGFSFFEDTPEKRDELTKKLHEDLRLTLDIFHELKDRPLTYNHGNDFHTGLDWAEHYAALVDLEDTEFKPSYKPPKEKSYSKEDFDITLLSEEVSVARFKALVNDYISIHSAEDLEHRLAKDGFHSNKYRGNKYLREEFIPLFYFLKSTKISDDILVKLGVQDENYDAKLTGKGCELIIEITMACPKNDYLLMSIVSRSFHGRFPLKTMAYLKKEIDSIPSKIIESIQKKHDKDYKDERVLLVVVQPDYTYQNEDYIIEEIVREVRESMVSGRGNFIEIFVLFGHKLYRLF